MPQTRVMGRQLPLVSALGIRDEFENESDREQGSVLLFLQDESRDNSRTFSRHDIYFPSESTFDIYFLITL